MGANVLIMAGGTGGHVFPALACAREFEARGYTVHWLGTPRGIENELVEPAGFTLHRINVTGLRGKSKLSLLKAPFVLLKALFQARRIIRQLKPVCVLGFGGYVTGPGGVAARLCGVPVVVHEQNARAGTANRLLVPLSEHYTLLDYVAEQGYPVALVTCGKLGSINHTLLSFEAIKNRDIALDTVLYNLYPTVEDKTIQEDTMKYIKQYLSKHFPGTKFEVVPEIV